MIAANEVRVCMNEAGARWQPFLFGVDFELSEGFFVLDPLGQQEILFEVGGILRWGREYRGCCQRKCFL